MLFLCAGYFSFMWSCIIEIGPGDVNTVVILLVERPYANILENLADSQHILADVIAIAYIMLKN